jgi:hypothetical protein
MTQHHTFIAAMLLLFVLASNASTGMNNSLVQSGDGTAPTIESQPPNQISSQEIPILERLSWVGTILQTFALIISLYFIYRQIKQQNDLTKAANAQSLVELASPFTLEVMQNPVMSKLWFNNVQNSSEYKDVDDYRYILLLRWWLTFYENIYQQNRLGLLRPEVYKAWDEDLKLFIKRRNILKYWDGLKGVYEDGYRMHVNDLIYEVLTESSA